MATRTVLWFLGMLSITIGVILARGVFVTIPDPALETLQLLFLRDSLSTAVPALGLALALVPMRSSIGVLSRNAYVGNVFHFNIRHLFLVTTMFAGIAAWCRFVASHEAVPLPNLTAVAVASSITLLGTIGAVTWVMSNHRGWLGGLIVAAVIVVSVTRSAHLTPLWFSILSSIYMWSIVIFTLIALSRLGFALKKQARFGVALPNEQLGERY